ncbi:MAG: DUF3311 domain-containing protein [Longimicrobiales bacterium]
MRRTLARWIFGTYLTASTIALTAPDFLSFNRVQPLVLGLPLSLFWVAAWVAAGVVVFVVVDRLEGNPGDAD